MIKRIFIAGFLILLLLSFAGCTVQSGSEANPLRICLDMTFTAVNNYSPRMIAWELEEYLEDERRAYCQIDDVEVELIPASGEERKRAIEKIRKEMEQGGGPDLFLISNATSASVGDHALFPFPERAMEEGLFLPLDSYIENAEFAEWDKHIEVIMEAGRTEDGQMIVPMSYTIPVTCYRASEVAHTPSAEYSWQNMQWDADDYLKNAGLWVRSRSNFYPQWEGGYLEYTFGDLADYSSGELLFTKQELLGRVQELMELSQAEEAGTFEGLPDHYQVCMNVGYTGWTSYSERLYGGIARNDALTMVPIYSDDGGTSATITSYAAVNANSKQPETAFMVLDFYLQRAMQRNAPLCRSMLENVGMPIHRDIGGQTAPVRTEGSWSWNLSMQNHQTFLGAVDQVTHVRFRDTLELQLNDLFETCMMSMYMNKSIENRKLTTVVYEAYEEMQRSIVRSPAE